jgi:periplasmic protein CpxP/Spy
MRLRMKAVMAALVVAVAGSFAAAGVVQAQDGFGPGHGGRGGFARHGGFAAAGLPLRALNLTDQQKEQVKGIFAQHKAELQQVRQRIRTAMEAQHAAAQATPPDDAAIRAQATTLAAAQADLAVAMAHIRTEVFAVLTPDQQQKAQELQQQRAQKRAEWEQKRQQQQQSTTPPQQ